MPRKNKKKENIENEINSKSDTSERTGNNNSSEKNVSSNGENDNSISWRKIKKYYL